MEKLIVNNYGSFDITFTKGKNATLWDSKNKKYIDFIAGIGVNSLGHNNKALVKAISKQAKKQIHISNYYFSDTGLSYSKKLLKELNFDHGYFGNSGAEANEAAIKLARKYGELNGGSKRKTIITLESSFHGRTLATLTATGQNKFHPECFAPYPEGFKTIKANDFESLENAFDDTCAALFMESIQGEGGVIPAPVKFLQTIRRVTKELGIPMICDEIQCGMGRSGKLFAFEYADIEPDVVLVSKAIGGTQPLAVVIYNKELDKWEPGAHAGTFRGNQLAMKAGTVVLNRVSKPDFLADVVRKGDMYRARVNAIKEKVSIIGDVRGKGLMCGIEFVDPRGPKDNLGSYPFSGEIAAKVQHLCFDNKLVMEKGGRFGSVMRCLCALNISDEDLNHGLDIFEKVVLEVNAEITGK